MGRNNFCKVVSFPVYIFINTWWPVENLCHFRICFWVFFIIIIIRILLKFFHMGPNDNKSHWLRWWLGAAQAARHCLNKCGSRSLTTNGITKPHGARITSQCPGGRFKKAYELLNLRALKFSPAHKMHIFQCMGKLFCVEFQRYPLKFHTKYISHTLKDMFFLYNIEILRALRFKSSYAFLKRHPGPLHVELF